MFILGLRCKIFFVVFFVGYMVYVRGYGILLVYGGVGVVCEYFITSISRVLGVVCQRYFYSQFVDSGKRFFEVCILRQVDFQIFLRVLFLQLERLFILLLNFFLYFDIVGVICFLDKYD